MGAVRDGRQVRRRVGRPITVASLLVALVLVGSPDLAGARAKKADGVKPASLVWRRSSASGAGNLNAIATDGKRFVVVGLISGRPAGVAPIWTSTDGVAWKRARVRGEIPAETILIDVVRVDGRFLAFGQTETGSPATLAWSSPDGLVWKRYRPKTFPADATSKPAVAAPTPDGVALIVGHEGTNTYSLWRSRDDKWTDLGPVPVASDAPVATLFALASAPGGKALTVGGLASRQAKAWYSKTGRGWTAAPVPLDTPDKFSEINAIVPLRSGLAALGTLDGPTDSEIPYAWFSKDGKSWTPDTASLPVFVGDSTVGQGMDAGVANGSGVLGAGHDGGSIALWTSPDGKRWNRVPEQPGFAIGSTPSVSAVAIARGRIVNLVRIRRFDGQSFNLVDLAIVTGAPR